MMMTDRYLVFRSFLAEREQAELVREAVECHRHNSSTPLDNSSTSSASQKIELGIGCGDSLAKSLPLACAVARRAFLQAGQQRPDEEALERLGTSTTVPLTGLALLYGHHASMPAHYDSPTQPGQRNEWLCMMTFGQDVRFRVNQDIVQLQSGDVLVMDSMATLHGVDSVVASQNDRLKELGLGSSRLGVLLWQGRDPVSFEPVDATNVEGVGALFSNDDE